jgi:hypothetical protein
MEFHVIPERDFKESFCCPNCHYYYESHWNNPEEDIWVEIHLKDKNNPSQKKCQKRKKMNI